MVAAVRADLRRWGITEDSGMAATALDLAERLSVPDVRPAAAAMLHAQLRSTLLELAKLATPEAKEGDPVDELQARREERRQRA